MFERCMPCSDALLEIQNLSPNMWGWRAVALSASEREEYLRCHKEASIQYQRYRHGGLRVINRHLLQLIGLTHPLRLICSGGALRPLVRLHRAGHHSRA